MTYALRYILLGFATALTLQLFANPPAWALVLAFWAGLMCGMAITVVMFWVDTQFEKWEKTND